MIWILDYLDDLDADFRVFYRIDGIADGQFGDLSAERFIALAERTPCYQGTIRALVEAQIREQEAEGGSTGARWDEQVDEDPWAAAARDQADRGLPPEDLGLTMEAV